MRNWGSPKQIRGKKGVYEKYKHSERGGTSNNENKKEQNLIFKGVKWG